MSSRPSSLTTSLETISLSAELRVSIRISGKLTCMCPVTKRRDYAIVEVSYTPTYHAVELGSFAKYLDRWANSYACHEVVTASIADDLMMAVEANSLTVQTTWEPAEGVACTVVASR